MEARNVHRAFSLISHRPKRGQRKVEVYDLEGSPFVRNGDMPVSFSYSETKYATVTSGEYSAEGEVTMKGKKAKVQTEDGEVVFKKWNNISYADKSDTTTLHLDDVDEGKTTEVIYRSHALTWKPMFYHHLHGMSEVKSMMMAKFSSDLPERVRVDRVTDGRSHVVGMDVSPGISIVPLPELSQSSLLDHRDILTLTNGKSYAEREIGFAAPFDMPPGCHIFLWNGETYESDLEDIRTGDHISKSVGVSYSTSADAMIETNRGKGFDRVSIRARISVEEPSKLTIRYFVRDHKVRNLQVKGIEPAPKPHHHGKYILFNLRAEPGTYNFRLEMDLE